MFFDCSMNPGDSKAREGIENVERANGGEMEHDSEEDVEEPNGEGVSLEEVIIHCKSSEPRSHFIGRWSVIVGVNVVLNRTVLDSD